MAGINGFGANFNKNSQVGRLGQGGQTQKKAQTQKKELTELKLNTNQVDGFVKSKEAKPAEEPQFAKKKDGDGNGGKKDKKSFGDYLNKHLDKFGGGEGLNNQANPEATAAGVVIVAFCDWAIHGFQ